MRGSIVAALAIACAVLMTGQVIAAAQGADQSPASAADSTSTAPAAPARTLNRADLVTLGLAVLSMTLIAATRWHRLDRASKRSVAFSPASAFFLLGAMFLLAPIGSAIAQTFFGVQLPEGASPASMKASDLGKLMLAACIARGLGVGAYVFTQAQARPPHPDRRAGLVLSIAIGTAGLLLTWPLVLAVVSLAGLLAGAPPEEIAHDTLRQLSQGPLTGWTAVMAALVVIAGPIIEEVMYRGLLQEAMRRAGASPWQAILLTSVLFALAHVGVVEAHALLGLFVLGLGLGWSYERTGRLWAPIVMHMLFNTGNLLMARAM